MPKENLEKIKGGGDKTSNKQNLITAVSVKSKKEP
jgi:hypothetical protein